MSVPSAIVATMATIYCTATSLDGYIADDEESLSWLFETANHESDPGGRHGDGSTLDFEHFIPGVGAVVCGANTYAWVHRELTKGARTSPGPTSSRRGSSPTGTSTCRRG